MNMTSELLGTYIMRLIVEKNFSTVKQILYTLPPNDPIKIHYVESDTYAYIRPLTIAACANLAENAAALISRGADVNVSDNGFTPVLRAGLNENWDTFYVLIECGANLATCPPDMLTDAYYYAIKNERMDALRILLDHDIKYNPDIICPAAKWSTNILIRKLFDHT